MHDERRGATVAAPHARLPSGWRGVAAVGQLAWLVGILTLWSVAVSRLPLDPDYTAGEMLDHLMAWMETGLLYPPLGEGTTLRVLNYPPLVFLLAGALTELGFRPIAAGRLVNTAGVLLLASVVYGWARARGLRGAELMGTVGLLGASFGVVYGAGQMHVEFWAVALTAAGFGLLECRRDRGGAVVAGLALALACFAKQSQVVPALVALAWAWRTHRGAARIASSTFFGVGVLGAAGITVAWGLEPWRHMLTYTVGTYALTNLGLQLLSHVLPWALLLGVAGYSVWRRRVERWDALAWYWVGSAAWCLSSVRVGSGYPYFLDLQVATLLLAGPWAFGSRLGRPWPLLLGLQVAAADLGAAGAAATTLLAKRDVAAALPTLCAAAPDGGYLLTEEAGLARACGLRPVLHPFIMTSLASRGLWDPRRLEHAIRAGAYSPALLPFDPRSPGRVHRERWPSSVLAAFRSAGSVRTTTGGHWIVEW